MTTWHSVPLGKVVTFQRGYDLPHRVRKQGGVPIVSSAGVTDYHDVPMVNPPGVVTGRYGTIGEIFLVTEPFWPLNTTLYVRDFHGNDECFVYYLLHRFDFHSFSGKSGVPGVNRNDLHVVSVSLPKDIVEQHAIAVALSDVDALLGGLDRLIAKKRDLKQAAMQQLVTGQTRLPGFSGEWEVKAIGEHIDLLTGFPFSSIMYSEHGVRLLRGSNVKRGETDWSDDLVQCWPRVTSDITKYELQPGDLVVAMDGSLVGRSYARLKPSDLPALLLQRVARIRSKTIDIGFLCQFVGSDHFIKYCDSVKTVTAIPHISASDIRSYRISIPPTLAEQSAIAAVLSDMDAELSKLVERRDKTSNLKQAMMQELLTGRIRLV